MSTCTGTAYLLILPVGSAHAISNVFATLDDLTGALIDYLVEAHGTYRCGMVAADERVIATLDDFVPLLAHDSYLAGITASMVYKNELEN